MDKLIEKIKRIDVALKYLNIPLNFSFPKLILLGEQKSGKSSLIELILDRQFLPKEENFINFHPLIINVVYDKDWNFIKFHPINKSKSFTFEEAKKEISTFFNKQFSSYTSYEPLELTIYTSRMPNMTIIELPGLLNNKNINKNIIQEIRNINLRYISDEDSLLFVTIPADVDLLNYDPVNLAISVDQKKTRTVGIVTKIDTLEKNESCENILNNSITPLLKGYIGVILSDKYSEIDEVIYFRTHKYNFFEKNIGKIYLLKFITCQLAQIFKDYILKLKPFISKKLHEIGSSSRSVSLEDEKSKYSHNEALVSNIKIFTDKLDSQLGFNFEYCTVDSPNLGAKLINLLNEKFKLEISKLKCSPELIKCDIKIAILNSKYMNGIFSPTSAFTSVVKSYIKYLEKPVLLTLEDAYLMLKNYILSQVEDEFKDFPNLISKIKILINDKIHGYHMEAENFLKLMVQIQMDHINTGHPDFVAELKNRQNQLYEPRKDINLFSNEVQKMGLVKILNDIKYPNGNLYNCVLRGQILFFYDEKSRTKLKESFNLSQSEIKNISNISFKLYNPNGEKMSKKYIFIELGFDNEDECKSWKLSLRECGVKLYDDNKILNAFDENMCLKESDLEYNIRYVFFLVECYLKMIRTNIHDVTIKTCVLTLISRLRNSLFQDMIVYLLPLNNPQKNSNYYIFEQSSNNNSQKSACKEVYDVIHEIDNEYFNNTKENLTQILDSNNVKKHHTFKDSFNEYKHKENENKAPVSEKTETFEI